MLDALIVLFVIFAPVTIPLMWVGGAILVCGIVSAAIAALSTVVAAVGRS